MQTDDAPLIVGFVADIMFTTQIDRVASHLDFRTHWIEQADYFGHEEIADPPGEPVHGRTAAMVDFLSAQQPALLLVDLANSAVPWQSWLPIIKSSPATRRIPVLAFGPHVDEAAMQAARDVGADRVVSRGRFTASMPDLIAQTAHTTNYDAVLKPCQEALHPDAVRGIALFNQREFYEAHHGLEDAWNADQGPGRDLYRSILQVAVAYLQIERRNYRGAVKMFLRVRQWLAPLPDVCRGVDVAQLRSDAETAYAALLELGEGGVGEFDSTLMKPVVLVSAEKDLTL